MPIKIDFLANTKDVTRGGQDIEETFEKVADSLDDVAKSGKQAGDKLGREIKDGSKTAESSVDKLDRTFKELADTSRRETGQASDSMKRNFSEGTSAAKRDLDELKNEAKQNAAETFSSFDGSVESFADGIQGTLGGIVSSLGPMGAVAGAAGALGIGLMIAAFDKAGTQNEAFKEDIAELGQEFIETGKLGETSIGFIADKLKSLATESGDGKVNLEELRKTADKSKTSFSDLAQAYAGNGKGLDDLIRKTKEHGDALNDQIIQSGDFGGGLTRQVQGLNELGSYLDQAKTKYDEAAKEQQNFIASGGPELLAKSQAMDDYASSIKESLGSAGESFAQFTVDGKTNLDEYNASIEAAVAAANAYQSNMVAVSSTLSQEALNYIQSLGVQAAPLLQAYVDAPLDQQARTAANWATLGTTAADSYTGGLIGSIPSQIPGSLIVTKADTKPATDDIWKVQNTKSETTMQVKADPKPAQSSITELTNAPKTTTVDVQADTGAAARDINNFVNEYRTAVVDVRFRYPDGKPVP